MASAVHRQSPDGAGEQAGAADGRTLYETESLKIEHFRSNSHNPNVAFIFSPFGNRILSGNLYGGNFLLENGFDVINFKTTQYDWFQSIPPEVFDAIEALCIRESYGRRVSMGSSMGGYAAICFSKLLKCDVVLAFSPQYAITDHFDIRFADYGDKIEWRYIIDDDAFYEKSNYYFVYDNFDDDKKHIEELRKVIPPDRLTEIRTPFSGHSTTVFLLETGLLKKLTLGVLRDERAPGRAELKKNRRVSIEYLKTISARLRDRGHSKLLKSLHASMASAQDAAPAFDWFIKKNIWLISTFAETLEMSRLRKKGFDVGFYLLANPDVANAGTHPLLHYARHGRREGRSARFRGNMKTL
ncbi:hypothetical protein [Methylocystis heyeri]|uniref:Alpha/beta hydrolase n=1 Tax=Methylocystis heyeri TaxID=391905 RepID=A0A6B8K9S0_9HYPH|nr:hypothetical protein [Methylocystis heyeri]QGM44477.1 hypothetical protein H2LOC_001500 [Methylocystis heyeri]